MNVEIERPRYLSPSTINSFVERKHDWFQRKILCKPWTSAHYFERGKAIELGIDLMFQGHDLAEATKLANKSMREAFGEMTLSDKDREECAKYALQMKEYLKVGYDALRIHGKYEGNNRKVSFNHPDIPLPLEGYLDFDFEGCVSDTKVLSKKPSKLSQSYMFQGIVYQWATNKPVVFDVLSRTKTRGVEHTPLWINKNPEKNFYEDYLIAAANALMNVYDAVNEGDTYKLMRAMAFPNLSAVWNANDRKPLIDEFIKG